MLADRDMFAFGKRDIAPLRAAEILPHPAAEQGFFRGPLLTIDYRLSTIDF
jgi:hypothetical protein